MSNKLKNNSNNFQSLNSVTTKHDNLSSKCSRGTNSNQKSAGNNEWNSVPTTYDKDESTRKNEKSETNNQWTSTSK